MGFLSFINTTKRREKTAKPNALHDWAGDGRQGVSFAASLGMHAITRKFAGRPVLQDVSLQLEPGEVVSLLGPSGSGKSTLLRIAAGLEMPDFGTVTLNEHEVTGPDVFVEPEKRGIGLIFQDYALFPHLTALVNVAFGLHKIAKVERKKIALAALERVGLEQRHAAYHNMLSGVEQQRVALARAMAPRPSVVLMDEPFSGLDARLRDQVRDESLSIVRETQASAMVVTHDPEEAMRISDRICLLKDGKVVQIGTPTDLYERPKSLFATRFFSEANLFSGKVKNGALQTIFGNYQAKNLAEGSNGVLCVREDGFDYARNPVDEPGEKGPFVAGIIKERRLLGAEELLTIVLNGHDTPVSARFPCHDVIAGHSQIYLRPKLRQRLVFESTQ